MNAVTATALAPQGGLAALLRARSVADLRERLLASQPALKDGDLKQVAILGAGPEGQRLAKICATRGIDIVGVYDGNARKRGMAFAGTTIYPSEALTRLAKDVPIVVASHRVLGACESLRAMGHVAVPFAFLQVGLPERFPPHMFYAGLLEDLFEHRQQYQALWQRLADDLSRRTLDAIIAYRLSLDPLELRGVIDWDLYGALQFGANEVYVDGGTYNGDSIQLFIEHVGGTFRAIHGFEPDKKTFAELSARFGDAERIVLHNAGLHSRSGTVGFLSDASRAAKIDPSSEIRIDVVSLDEAVSDPITFIKMNIEGSEIDALNGARAHLERSAPKLAISAYHRPSDLWHIPALITELNERYTISLRQHDGGTIESVIYATLPR